MWVNVFYYKTEQNKSDSHGVIGWIWRTSNFRSSDGDWSKTCHDTYVVNGSLLDHILILHTSPLTLSSFRSLTSEVKISRNTKIYGRWHLRSHVREYLTYICLCLSLNDFRKTFTFWIRVHVSFYAVFL